MSQQPILGQWRIRITKDDGYETSIFDNPDDYSDVPDIQDHTVNGLREGTLAGLDVSVEIAVPGGWEHVGGILTVASSEFEGKTYGSLAEIKDEHIRSLADDVVQQHLDALNNAPVHQLQALALKVGLQEGTDQPDGWDDPATVMRMVELMKEARITAV